MSTGRLGHAALPVTTTVMSSKDFLAITAIGLVYCFLASMSVNYAYGLPFQPHLLVQVSLHQTLLNQRHSLVKST